MAALSSHNGSRQKWRIQGLGTREGQLARIKIMFSYYNVFSYYIVLAHRRGRYNGWLLKKGSLRRRPRPLTSPSGTDTAPRASSRRSRRPRLRCRPRRPRRKYSGTTTYRFSASTTSRNPKYCRWTTHPEIVFLHVWRPQDARNIAWVSRCNVFP
jgi:hypothetical protein